MKTKAMIHLILQSGGMFVRSSGSHRVYRLGDQTLVVPFSGAHLEVSNGLKCKLLKQLKGAGL